MLGRDMQCPIPRSTICAVCSFGARPVQHATLGARRARWDPAGRQPRVNVAFAVAQHPARCAEDRVAPADGQPGWTDGVVRGGHPGCVLCLSAGCDHYNHTFVTMRTEMHLLHDRYEAGSTPSRMLCALARFVSWNGEYLAQHAVYVYMLIHTT